MRILGFDPSLTNFGWCILDFSDDNALPTYVKSGRFQTSSKTLFVRRYMDLRASIFKLISEESTDKVGCEYPVFKDIYSEGMYGLFLYTNEALYQSKQDVVYFSPGQIKSAAKDFLKRPSSWKMVKLDMVEASKNLIGKKINHNEADALWCAYLAGRFWQLQESKIKEEDLSVREKQMFLEVKTFTKGSKKGQTVNKGILYREDERYFQWSIGE
jgi:Holliday junction resolvasome RuvABC endonuclease subunit